MNSEIASDEVTDSIAHIEMHRQEAVKEVGLAAACAEALRKLNALLEQERAAAQLLDPKGGHSPNVEAVTQEIKKVKGLAGNTTHDTPRTPRNARPAPARPGPHGPPRNKGRRTMGRTGGGR